MTGNPAPRFYEKVQVAAGAAGLIGLDSCRTYGNVLYDGWALRVGDHAAAGVGEAGVSVSSTSSAARRRHGVRAPLSLQPS